MEFYRKITRSCREIAVFPRYSEREKWKMADVEPASAFLSISESLLGKVSGWPELTKEAYREFAENGNRVNYETPYFDRRYDFIDLMVCECLDGEGRFFDDIALALKKICDEPTWCLPAHNPDITAPDLGASNPTLDLFAAETASSVATALYLLGDELSAKYPETVERAYSELSARVKRPYLERDFWWMLRGESVKPSNWSSWICMNVLLTFVLTEDDAGLIDKCAFSSSETIKKLYDYLPDDGECDEGVAYWNVSPLAIYNFVEIMRAASGEDIPLSEKMKKFAAYPHAMHISGGKYFNYGDCVLSPPLNYHSAYRFALEAGNSGAAGFYREKFSRYRYTEIGAFRTLKAFFVRYDDAPAGVEHESAYYSGGILMTVHEGEYSVAVKGGGTSGGHTHVDAGSYIIYKSGQPVAIDVGRATYTRDTFSEARFTLWYNRSSYHNLPTINGFEQNAEFGRARPVSYGDGMLKLDITGAYRGAGLNKYIRTVSASSSGVEVCDELEFEENNNHAEFHIMTALRPEIKGGGIVIGDAALKVEANENFTVTAEKIALDDRLLLSQWGSEIYRVKINVATSAKSIVIEKKIE